MNIRYLKIARYAALSCFMAVSTGVKSASAEDLVIYSAYPRAQLDPLIEAFQKQNPEINVRQLEQPGEELITTLELELRANNPQADIVGLNEASMAYLQSKHNALEPYSPRDIEKVVPEFRLDGDLATPLYVTLYTIHYNTGKVAAGEVPKSWEDLLDPKWNNKISIADPSHSQSIQSFIWFIAEYLGQKDPNRYGWTYFQKLAENNPRLEGSHGTIRDLTVSGERPIGVQVLYHAQTTAQRGEPTGDIWPAEGTPAELNVFALVKGAPHAEAAKKWLDFLVSKEAQALVPDAMGGAPVRVDTDYVLPDGTPLDAITIVPVDADYINAHREEQTRHYHEAMGK